MVAHAIHNRTGNIILHRKEADRVCSLSQATQTWMSVDTKAGEVVNEHRMTLNVAVIAKMIRSITLRKVDDITGELSRDVHKILRAMDFTKRFMSMRSRSELLLFVSMFQHRAEMLTAASTLQAFKVGTSWGHYTAATRVFLTGIFACF